MAATMVAILFLYLTLQPITSSRDRRYRFDSIRPELLASAVLIDG